MKIPLLQLNGVKCIFIYENDTLEFVGTMPKRDMWGQGIDFDVDTNTLFVVKRGYSISKNKIIYAHMVSQGNQLSICRIALTSNQRGLSSSNAWTKIKLDSAGIDFLDDFDKKREDMLPLF